MNHICIEGGGVRGTIKLWHTEIEYSRLSECTILYSHYDENGNFISATICWQLVNRRKRSHYFIVHNRLEIFAVHFSGFIIQAPEVDGSKVITYTHTHKHTLVNLLEIALSSFAHTHTQLGSHDAASDKYKNVRL